MAKKVVLLLFLFCIHCLAWQLRTPAAGVDLGTCWQDLFSPGEKSLVAVIDARPPLWWVGVWWDSNHTNTGYPQSPRGITPFCDSNCQEVVPSVLVPPEAPSLFGCYWNEVAQECRAYRRLVGISQEPRHIRWETGPLTCNNQHSSFKVGLTRTLVISGEELEGSGLSIRAIPGPRDYSCGPPTNDYASWMNERLGTIQPHGQFCPSYDSETKLCALVGDYRLTHPACECIWKHSVCHLANTMIDLSPPRQCQVENVAVDTIPWRKCVSHVEPRHILNHTRVHVNYSCAAPLPTPSPTSSPSSTPSSTLIPGQAPTPDPSASATPIVNIPSPSPATAAAAAAAASSSSSPHSASSDDVAQGDIAAIVISMCIIVFAGLIGLIWWKRWKQKCSSPQKKHPYRSEEWQRIETEESQGTELEIMPRRASMGSSEDESSYNK